MGARKGPPRRAGSGSPLLAGIGKKEFDACFDDKALEDQVTQSRLVGSNQQLGVNATPTFFINGKKFDGEPTVEAIDQMLSGLAENLMAHES